MSVPFISGKLIDLVLKEVLIFASIVNDTGCLGHVDGERWTDTGS